MLPFRPRRLSRKGAKFIANFEGFRSHAYHDAVGVWTIGYGHTEGVRPGQVISEAKARNLLRKDAKPVAKAVLASTPLRLRQNELDALISFGFNLGPGYFSKGHTIGNALHRGNRPAIAQAFLIYDQAGGHSLPGLTRRRWAERHLFLRK